MKSPMVMPIENPGQYALFFKAARLMRIPAENCANAIKELLRVVKQCEADHYEEKVRENLKTFERIALLCDGLSKEIHRLNPSGKEYLQYRVDDARRRVGTYRDVLSVLDKEMLIKSRLLDVHGCPPPSGLQTLTAKTGVRVP